MPVTAIVDASGKVKLYHILVDGFIAISILVVYWFLRQGLSPVLAMSVSIPTYLTAHFLRLYVLKLECGIPVKPYLVSFMLPAIVVTFLSVALNGCLEHFVKLSMITELCVVTLSSIIINLILIYLLLLNSGERSRIKDLIITRQK